jgi:hypothetical protein
MTGIPVSTFDDPELVVIKGLKKRFADDGRGFTGIRISALKDESATTEQPKYELTVSLRGGRDYENGTLRDVGISILAFAPNDAYGDANRLAEVVCEYLKSLVALGTIKYVTLENTGTHINNPGEQQLRQITATVRVQASKTTLY